MSLEDYFDCPRTLKRHREGPLSMNLDGFVGWLEDAGYTYHGIRKHLGSLAHLSGYMIEKGIVGASGLREEHLTDFLKEHLPNRQSGRKGAYRTIVAGYTVHRFVQYLKSNDLMDQEREEENRYWKIQEEYQAWLRDFQNNGKGTCHLRSQYLKVFLEGMGAVEKVEDLSAEMVEQFFLDYARDHELASRRSMQATLRTFLRFCHLRGYLGQDLSSAVPTLRTYRLNKVPRGLDAKDAERIISSTRMDSPAGIRNNAILRILYTYGIRGGQLRRLRLEDIDWVESQIRFPPMKQGKEVIEPLTYEIGESLLTYLEKARPRTKYQEVFLTTRAPYRPLGHNALSQLVRCCLISSGIEAQCLGAHVFRHTFVSRLLAQGESLKTVADMLGHRYLSTTWQYAKIDFRSLHQVALDWPEVES